MSLLVPVGAARRSHASPRGEKKTSFDLPEERTPLCPRRATGAWAGRRRSCASRTRVQAISALRRMPAGPTGGSADRRAVRRVGRQGRRRVRRRVRGRVRAMSARSFSLTPGKRVLYLTKDPDKIRQQLAGSLTLTMNDVSPEELLDDINTDAMPPAWVCFDYDPAEIAKNSYAGLIVDGQRLFPPNALSGGGFEVIASGAEEGA